MVALRRFGLLAQGERVGRLGECRLTKSEYARYPSGPVGQASKLAPAIRRMGVF